MAMLKCWHGRDTIWSIQVSKPKYQPEHLHRLTCWVKGMQETLEASALMIV